MGKMMQTITILNWEKYNPRHDYKASSWFRMENKIFFDPQWADFSCQELMVWVYLLSYASWGKNHTFDTDLPTICRYARVDEKNVQTAFKKLQQKQCVKLSSVRARVKSVQKPYATNVTNERTNIREKSTTLLDDSKPVEILEHLNKVCDKSFKPKECNLKFIRARLRDYPEEKLRAVIDSMHCKWGKDPKMRNYLRPQTLFNETKFETYVQEVSPETNHPGVKYGWSYETWLSMCGPHPKNPNLE